DADHTRRISQSATHVAYDLSIIFKYSLQSIPALKALTTEEDLFNQSVATSADKMAAMKTLTDLIRDGWRVGTGAVKNFVGLLSEGAVGMLRLVGIVDSTQFKKLAEELKGQKPG